jgi:hypothetical protein
MYDVIDCCVRVLLSVYLFLHFRSFAVFTSADRCHLLPPLLLLLDRSSLVVLRED